jgi:hypothetical protein
LGPEPDDRLGAGLDERLQLEDPGPKRSLGGHIEFGRD